MADPIKALEEQLEDLRRAFELYFLGIEKRLPAPHRAEVERVIRRFRPGKDSIARFRYANLTMRLQTLQRYWDRTIKAMEDGTYIRDIQRANRKAEAVQRTEARAEAPSAARQAEAAQAAQAVGDEAEAFLASLRGTPKLPSPPMRGAPVGEPAPPMRGTPVGEPSVPPMRGAPVRSRPSTPAPLRGAPVSERPSTPEAPAPAPSPPMRGAPVGRELPAAPLRGAPVGRTPPPLPPRGTPKATEAEAPGGPALRGTPKGLWSEGDGRPMPPLPRAPRKPQD